METIVLVVNFNGEGHLQECLSSLISQTYHNIKIIVIDDCSTDGSIVFIKNKFPAIEVVALKNNLGFAKVVNYGINYSLDKYNPDYIAILNNDIRVDKAWLKNLVTAIKSDGKIVAVASNMLFYDHPNIINSQGGRFTFSGYGLDINFNRNKAEVNNFQKDILASCWGSTLIKRESFRNVGLLDENYYSYFEDLDWGYRANLLGYKIIFEPSAVVYHKGSATWGNYQFKKIYLCRRNSLYTILKNYEFKNIVKALPIIILDYFILYPGGYLLNRKIENGKLVPLFKNKNYFIKRIKFLPIPFMAFYWNLHNLSKTLKLRKNIQATRKISDKEIFKLSQKS
ncbi:MAG: glycosyltransferase family 2 protein [Patescibacteria group bacterium]|nr:glycosyltransferase family 2 protein [Patescibacteria group bacterium]